MSESTKQGEEWGPLQDLVEKWREYGNSPVPKNTGGMPKEEYHAARMQALVCADQLADLAPLLARKVEEEKREALYLAALQYVRNNPPSAEWLKGFNAVALGLNDAEAERARKQRAELGETRMVVQNRIEGWLAKQAAPGTERDEFKKWMDALEAYPSAASDTRTLLVHKFAERIKEQASWTLSGKDAPAEADKQAAPSRKCPWCTVADHLPQAQEVHTWNASNMEKRGAAMSDNVTFAGLKVKSASGPARGRGPASERERL